METYFIFGSLESHLSLTKPTIYFHSYTPIMSNQYCISSVNMIQSHRTRYSSVRVIAYNIPNVHVPLFMIFQLILLIRSDGPMIAALSPSKRTRLKAENIRDDQFSTSQAHLHSTLSTTMHVQLIDNKWLMHYSKVVRH